MRRRGTAGSLAERFRLSPRRKVQALDHRGHPIIVIDDFYADPWAVRRVALGLDYLTGRNAYPGSEANLWIPGHRLCPLLDQLVSRVWRRTVRVAPRFEPLPTALPPSRRFRAARRAPPPTPTAALSIREIVAFSAFSPPPVYRNQPHFDDPSDSALACLVFLNPPDQCRGGTAFYRHRKTGFAAMPPRIDARMARRLSRLGYRSTVDLARDLTFVGAPRVTGPDHWEPVWSLDRLIDMRWNRLVCYPGNLLHGLFVRPGDFGDTLATTRLTLNMFFSLVDVPRRRSPRRRARAR